jgi:hypothetical protein
MSGLSGMVLVNGDRQPANFKCIAGYVVQVCGCGQRCAQCLSYELW